MYDLHLNMRLTFGLDDLGGFFGVFNNSMIPCNSRVIAINGLVFFLHFFQHKCIFRRAKVMRVDEAH